MSPDPDPAPGAADPVPPSPPPAGPPADPPGPVGAPARPPRARTEPAPMVKPARGELTIRDMFVALGVLMVVVFVIGGVSRGFSFAPTGPTVDPAGVPVVDAPAELRSLAPDTAFALRIPAVPPGWRANSVARDVVAGTDRRAVRVGYLTAQSEYLQLLQSDAAEEALVAAQAGTRRLVAQGTQDVAGQRWVVYGTRPDEPVWIADVGAAGGAPVRLVISGSGTDDDYRALAGAVRTGELLRPR